MEILNNFFNILNMENAWATKLLTFPLIFVEISLSLHIFISVLKIDIPKYKKIIYIIAVSLFSIISSIVIPEPYNIFINYTFIFLILKLYFLFTVLQSILAIILPFATFGLVNSLILNPFLKIFNTTYEAFFITPVFRLTYLFITYIIIAIIVLLLKNAHFKIHPNFTFDPKTNTILLISLILGILTLVIQTFMTVYYYSTIPVVFTLFNFLLLFAYFFTSIYSLTRVIKLNIATRNLENAESYNNSLTILYDNVRGFKHDFDNMVNIIGGYIQVNDINGLKNYYNSLQKDCSKVKNVQMLNPNIINNPGIYNLIVSKYKKASDLNVSINFEFFFDFNKLHMPIYEFSRVLGILLDNAIESAEECEDKEVNLIFRESRKHQVQIIIIENTYLNRNIDTSKIYEKGISGKKNHTGIGLWEVNKIITNYNNIVLKTSKDDKYFKQELQIYY